MKKLNITLVIKNRDADFVNEAYLKDLPGNLFSFHADTTGTGEAILQKSLVEKVLRFKIGSQIMFLRNLTSGVVNGLMGFVKDVIEGTSLNSTTIIVETEYGDMIEVKRETWRDTEFRKETNAKNAKFYEHEKGKFIQFPLKLANAFSVHKSQGLTFSEVRFDNRTATFANGQLYVCLSRCKTLEGLTLTHSISVSDVRVNKRALSFYNKCANDQRYLRILHNIKHNLYVPEMDEEEDE